MNPPYPKPPRTIKLATLFAVMLAVILVLGGARFLTWSYESSEALVINNMPVPVQPPEVKDGGKVYLTINYCMKKTLLLETSVRLVGEQGAIVNVAWPTSTVQKGCNLLADVPVSIPGQAPTDKYYVEFSACGDINPLKKNKCTVFKSKPFKVINSKLSPGDAQVEEKM